MTNQAANNGPAGAVAATLQERARTAEIRKSLLGDIRLKWGKFTDQELKNLTSNDDLVSQLVGKYGMDRAKAQLDVDVLCAGRNI